MGAEAETARCESECAGGGEGDVGVDRGADGDSESKSICCSPNKFRSNQLLCGLGQVERIQANDAKDLVHAYPARSNPLSERQKCIHNSLISSTKGSAYHPRLIAIRHQSSRWPWCSPASVSHLPSP